MHNLKSTLTRVLPYIIILSFLLLFAILNFSKGTIIFGLDNASPYFDFNVTVQRILNSDNIFQYGGVIFALPFTALRLLNLNSSIISQAFILSSLALGIINFFRLLSVQKLNFQTKLVLPILLIANLVPMWIFSQPTFLFVASFAGIPSLILYLGNSEKKFIGKILILFGVLYFAMTIINPIAFALYSLQIFLITNFLFPESKKKISRFVLILSLIIAVLQLFIFIRGSNTFVGTELVSYLKSNITSPIAHEVTESLRTAELKNNSLINTVRFATGWLELNDINNKNVFIYSRLYAKNLLFIIIGVLPLILFIIQIFRKKISLTKHQIRFTYLFISIVAISTTYALLLINFIPLIRDGLRWVSSKTWPTIYIGVLYFSVLGIDNLIQEKSRISKVFPVVVAILLCIYAFPWYLGPIINKYSRTRLPIEYLELSTLSKKDTLIVLPKPQKLFFRSYSWGYYGTDFISYLSYAKIIDGTKIEDVQNYDQRNTNESYYVLEEVGSSSQSICNGKLVESNQYFTLTACNK